MRDYVRIYYEWLEGKFGFAVGESLFLLTCLIVFTGLAILGTWLYIK